MLWSRILGVFFILYALPASAHEPIVLDARRATPGLRLELKELNGSVGSTEVKYRLRPSGLPRAVVFNVWVKDFGHSFHQIASGFQLTEFGKLVWIEGDEPSSGVRELDKVEFGPGLYPRGALWEVAIVSVDQTLKAFAKTIPYPITASDGACSVSLELVSQRGERFLASGVGFFPGEQVVIESQYSGRVTSKRERVAAPGTLSPDVISHAATGSDRSARYTVKGHSCKVVVDYEWGERALVRR
jgi:hypothetical protein